MSHFFPKTFSKQVIVRFKITNWYMTKIKRKKIYTKLKTKMLFIETVI